MKQELMGIAKSFCKRTQRQIMLDKTKGIPPKARRNPPPSKPGMK